MLREELSRHINAIVSVEERLLYVWDLRREDWGDDDDEAVEILEDIHSLREARDYLIEIEKGLT